MNNIFDQLFENADSNNALENYLDSNMRIVSDFYNSNYRSISSARNSIEKFILLKHGVVSQLDFKKTYVKSFALMLLDYCERFNFISSTPHIYRILDNNNISINYRQKAALKFSYPRPTTNDELVERFDSICKNLQLAIDFEEDNDRKAIATFLNYFGIIVIDTSSEYVEQVKSKINHAISNNNYQFLSNKEITELLNISTQNKDDAFSKIQNLIDRVIDKERPFITLIGDTGLPKKPIKEFLIETNTDYSKKLISAKNNFNSIRHISIYSGIGENLTNRGVKILESEDELLEYMIRFGNMHKAKLEVALEALPDSFATDANIIDWGCGQGIASMIFIEKYGTDIISNLTLIEPSKIALKRAALHVRKYDKNIPIKTICKKLDSLKKTDFKAKHTSISIHLFSNILDIDDYSQNHLIKIIESTQSGTNYFVCVSPYIDDIKTERLDSFKRHFISKYHDAKLLLDINSFKSPNDHYWCCNNTYKYNKITHGEHSNCEDYTENGCKNKWTRVIKVFKIDF